MKNTSLNFENLAKAILILDRSLSLLNQQQDGSVEWEIFRSAVIKNFEITLELSGKLIKKVLRDYVPDQGALRRMVFKDILREAAVIELIADVKPWFRFRDLRNDTAHEYGEEFILKALPLIQEFLKEVKKLYLTLAGESYDKK